MSTPLQSELEAFHQYLSVRLREGDVHASPEELLLQWRAAQTPGDVIEDLKSGLEEFKAGKAEPLEKAFEDLRIQLRGGTE